MTCSGTAMAEEFPHYIEFRHVYKTFDKPVLVDSSFQVDTGQTVAISGRSGEGDCAGAGGATTVRSLRRAHHHGGPDHERSSHRANAAAEEAAELDVGGGNARSGPDASGGGPDCVSEQGACGFFRAPEGDVP